MCQIKMPIISESTYYAVERLKGKSRSLKLYYIMLVENPPQSLFGRVLKWDIFDDFLTLWGGALF